MAMLAVSVAFLPRIASAQHVGTYRSPDGTLLARYVPVNRGCPESRLSISGHGSVLYRKDFASADCEHGSVIVRGEWTPDSRFFAFNIESTGGHQPGHKPVLFYSRVENKLYRLENFIGYIVAQDFTLKAPHTLQTEKQKVAGGAEGTRIEVDLSRVGSQMRRSR